MSTEYECVDLGQLVRGAGGILHDPGVYSIYWFRNDRYVPIGKLLGVDAKGTLYIGFTKDMKKRLR